MRPQRHVLIIGGGIAGPALALFLKRAGFAPSVFEAYPDRAELGGSLGLAPNGMNVLDELGLADRILAAGSPMTRAEFRDVHGKVIGITPDIGSRYGRPGVTLSRATLHAVIVDAATAAGIPVRYGKRLSDIRADGDGVVATFADGSKERGEFLVGADGINSRVRELILPDGPKPEFTGLVGPGGFVPRSAMPASDDERALVLYYGPGIFFGYGYGDNVGEGGAFWWTAIGRDHPLSDAERKAVSLDEVRNHILASSNAWDPSVRRILDATTTFIPPLNIFDVATLPRWSDGRVVLIGDAAHAASPHSGQGASIALEDTIVLAKILRDHAGPIEEAFARFEQERRKRVERIVAFGRRSGDTKKKQGAVTAWLQRLMMPLLIRIVGRMQASIYNYRVRWDGDVIEPLKRAA